MSRTRSVLVTLTVAVICSVLGATIALLLRQDSTPASLRPVSGSASYPVRQQILEDVRTVTLDVEFGDTIILRSDAEGTVTNIPVRSATTLASGGHAYDVDGEPVFALASEIPLWRELRVGDKGTDVRALQQALIDLGYGLIADGEMGERTLRSVAHLRGITDETAIREFDTVTTGMFMWSPAPVVTVKKVHIGVGQKITPGDNVFELHSGLRSLAVSQMPDNIIDGEHVIIVDGDEYSIDARGQLTDPSSETLAAIQGSKVVSDWEKHRTEDSTRQLSVPMKLKNPLTVHSISPSCVYALEGTRGCVTDGHSTYRVSVIGSELGQTYVQFDPADTIPETLTTPSGSEPSCG